MLCCAVCVGQDVGGCLQFDVRLRPASPPQEGSERRRRPMPRYRRFVALLLLVGHLDLLGAKKKRTKKQWEEAFKRVEEEEFEEWEQEKKAKDEEYAKYHGDPMKMVEEMGGPEAGALASAPPSPSPLSLIHI